MQIRRWLMIWLLTMSAVFALGGCRQSPERMAMERGADFLAQIQRADGAICDTVNPLFDIWETVEAATALWECYHDADHPVLQRALAFLKTHENPEGLLCHNVKCRASYCLETTSEYLLLLAQIQGKEAIQSRMARIQQLQKPSGEWEIGNPDVLENKAFPSVTAFVLAAFQAAEMQPLYADSAWAWLLRQQNADGNWGMAWEYYGCTAYAMWPAMRALKQADFPGTKAAMDKAMDYIYLHKKEFLFWDETLPNSPKNVSRELQTALVLNSLPDLDEHRTYQSATSGLQFLLAQQKPDGHWDGGHFPIASARYNKEEYVFATARAMVAIQFQIDHQP